MIESQNGSLEFPDENIEHTCLDVKAHETGVVLGGGELTVIDVPGLEDTSQRLSNKAIRQKVELSLLDTLATQLDAVLVFQSLATDYVTIRKSITVRTLCYIIIKSPLDIFINTNVYYSNYNNYLVRRF